MSRDDSSSNRDPEDRRNGRSGTARPYGGPGRRELRGRSGYGTESIRPHLRAQIEYQKLLRPTFPPEDPDEDSNHSNQADG